MSDTFGGEPPAKRARLQAPSNEAAEVLDAPGSPVDDMDDDFYETTPVKPASLPVEDEGNSLSALAAPTAASLSSFNIPGLGLRASSISQEPSDSNPAVLNDQDEDGEISDSASLYNDSKPTHIGQVGAQDLSTHGPSLSHSNEKHVVESPTVDPEKGVKRKIPTADEPPTNDLKNHDSFMETSLMNVIQKDTASEAESQAITSRAEFLEVGKANTGNKDAEWQLDSENSDSSSGSSSDDSSDSSSDEDGEVSDEGELLDPEEQVRRLMMEATDDAGAGNSRLRTLNEMAEVYDKPDIEITDDTKITELGKVESIVDQLVLIRAKVSGDFQVLESGSALCLSNRTVIGKISETLGRVQEPRYSLGFSNPAEIEALGITKDTMIYFVNEHSTFVQTEPLKAQRFTDASNLHDEEADDMDFSDDEKEAEHRRKQKGMKKARAEANRDNQEKALPASTNDKPAGVQPGHYQGGGLNYSDDDEDLGMYKPLARPDHFEDIVGAGAPIEDRSHVRRGGMRAGKGGWPDRGRGFRGRGGRGGGGGGGGGGGRNNQRGQFAGGSEKHGRHQEHNRNRNAQQQQARAASSASPNRQNHARPPPQRSPPRGNSSSKRQRYHSSPVPKAPRGPKGHKGQPSGNANNNSHTHSSSSNAMPGPPAASQPTNSYAPANPPTIPAGSYVNPAFYPQPAAPPAPQQQQQQQNLAQWAQWLQYAATMSNTQPQPQQQHQAAPAAPAYNPTPNNAQAGTPSLQDILRALGGGSQPR